ncbi:uncharacterized protein A1O9_05628 [Exophiala aquamarina CBS 119918]|uniref:Carboxylesterase family protein n=1 Tax=Exophiala aquamarina CBS 119918 TaxID=1182545 RepID=A0A072PQC7_9EURO|nr:uncharacterized protein A1O9_05628 [Exophiala aquamarina CBS 119918]KEF57710.1 hypothetical protein A1O9_05628 [Exophiala aquamarina CBS 119918]
MPRITRAALKAQAQDQGQDELQAQPLIHEDSDADAEVPVLRHPETSLNTNQDPASRPALKDITHENQPTSDDVFTDEPIVSVKKTKSKRKGTQTENNIEQTAQEAQETQTAPIPGESQQTPQSTIPSFKDGNDTTHEGVNGQESIPEQSYCEPFNTPSQVVQSPEQETSSTRQPSNTASKTPKFNPVVHVPEPLATVAIIDTVEDSFIDKIKTRSPSKMQSYSEGHHSPVSLAEQSTSQTPRIEDSVEAIDALEDAIERISQGLPRVDGLNINSPAKSTKKPPSPVTLEPRSRAPNTLKKAERTLAKNTGPSPPKAVNRPRPTSLNVSTSKTTNKPAVVVKQHKKLVVDGSKPKEAAVPQPPSLSFSSSPAKALPNMTKKRVPSTSLSTSKPGFVPAKSSKAPTKSTFSLPGEVISAKLKVQREERLKKEEEAERAKKNFKARPVPSKIADPSVKPRDNKASQGRLSIYAGGLNKENIEPPKVIVRRSRPMSMIEKPRTDPTRANSGVRRTTSVAARPSTSKVRESSIQLSSGQKSSVSKGEVIQQRATGKEVFGRNKAEIERLENERKEKEEAARKARADAAERGRQASREWAEKQKKKLAVQAASKQAAEKSGRGPSTAVSAAS